MPKNLGLAVLTGLLSSGLFFLVFGANLGFVFMFLPSLPLFFLGLGEKSRTLHIAVFIATLIVAAFTGAGAGTMYLVFLGLPSLYFARKALLRAQLPEGVVWFPVGRIIMTLALYATGLVGLMVWYYAGRPGGLPHMLAQNVHEAFSELEGQYGDIIDQMATGFAFLMFPVTIWLWGLLLFVHAWLANRLLASRHKQVRPDLAVTVFTIPAWLLQPLAIAGLATLIGGPSMAFLGKSALLILMLPYFFLGCALMHAYCDKWPDSAISNRFFIFFVYFLVFTQFWPVLILAAIGLWHQIKGLSESGSWFRS